MLYIMDITDITNYILAGFKFGIRTLWGCHRRDDTLKDITSMYARNLRIDLVLHTCSISR